MNMNEAKFGLMKLTLLDFPGRMACTIFTNGCNFRCPFCHNATLATGHIEGLEMLSLEEILAFLRKREGILDGVCITGGEPLLHESVFELMRGIRTMDYAIKLDTNGSFPDRLRSAVENGLADYVAMDIKNAREKYAVTAGFTNEELLKNVCASADFLMNGKLDFEFRTTVVAGLHEDKDFDAIGQWIRGTKKYFLQKYVDSGDVLGDTDKIGAAPDEAMRRYLEIVRKYVPGAQLRGM